MKNTVTVRLHSVITSTRNISGYPFGTVWTPINFISTYLFKYAHWVMPGNIAKVLFRVDLQCCAKIFKLNVSIKGMSLRPPADTLALFWVREGRKLVGLCFLKVSHLVLERAKMSFF